MNGADTEDVVLLPDEPDRERWGWRRMLVLIALAFIAHLFLISFFQKKQPLEVLPVGKTPHIELTSRADALMELGDPALFTIPNPQDYGSAIWLNNPQIPLPSFRWTENPRWLPIAGENLGAAFHEYMQTNVFAMLPLTFKSDPEFTLPDFAIDPGLATNSTLMLSRSLANRLLLTQPSLPSLPFNDVIAPSRVRIGVDDMGQVVSAVLITPDSSLEAAGHSDVGDSNALVQVRGLRFRPSSQYTFGEVIFNWHTIPVQNIIAP